MTRSPFSETPLCLLLDLCCASSSDGPGPAGFVHHGGCKGAGRLEAANEPLSLASGDYL